MSISKLNLNVVYNKNTNIVVYKLIMNIPKFEMKIQCLIDDMVNHVLEKTYR